MKNKMFCLLVGLVAFSPAMLRAEETKPEGRPSREEFKKLSPEEREAKMKEWREKNPNAGGPGGGGGERFRAELNETAKQIGLDPEKLKDLPQEERRAKFREAAQAKSAELKKKKEAGTITDDEQKLLDKLDTWGKRAEEFRRRGGPGGPGGQGGPGHDRDARKPAIQGGEEKKQ